jgi:hypothetical protein
MARPATLGRRALIVFLPLMIAALATPQAPASARSDWAMRVIVQARDAASARALVNAAGGRVGRDLPIVNGVSAVISASGADGLESTPGVRVIGP